MELYVIPLYEHADSLGEVTTVKRVVRVFRDLTPQLRDKINRSLVTYYYYYYYYYYYF